MTEELWKILDTISIIILWLAILLIVLEILRNLVVS